VWHILFGLAMEIVQKCVGDVEANKCYTHTLYCPTNAHNVKNVELLKRV